VPVEIHRAEERRHALRRVEGEGWAGGGCHHALQ
jgi:hypothetical protein